MEERLIGLGTRSIVLRLCIAFLPISVAVLIPGIQADSDPKWSFLNGHPLSLRRWLSRVDLAFVLAPLWAPLLGWHFDHAWARVLCVGLVWPNVLRHGCIVLMSSYCHYYGDIPKKDALVQCQIIRSMLLLPFQVFCCAFGSTHVIHHVVVGQTFYVRHLVRKAAWAVLEAHGTRVDDWGIVARANRYNGEPLPSKNRTA